MAEVLSLASLTVDPSGVVLAGGVVRDTFGKTAAETRRFAETVKGAHGPVDALTHRMFSLREAATAFLGAFTIGGGVLAFKSFVTGIYESSPAFHNLEEALKSTKSEFNDFARAALGADQAVSDLAAVMNAVGHGIQEAKGATVAGGGLILKAMFGNTPIGQVIEAFTLANQLLHGTAQAARAGALAEPPPTPAQKLPEDLWTDILRHTGTLPHFARRLDEQTEVGKEPFGDQWFENMGVAAQKVIEIGEGFETIAENASHVSESNLGPVTEDLKDLSAEMEVATSIAQAFGAGVSSALFEGGKSFKEAIGEQMMALSQMLTGLAVTELVLAAIGSTPWGAAMVGPAPKHLHNAAVAAAGAAATFALGSALGAHRGGSVGFAGSGGGGDVLGAPGLGGGRAAPNVTIIVQGSMLGTSPDQLSRGIVDLWVRGTKDMGGADLVVARASSR